MPETVREALKEWQRVYFQRLKASETDNLVFPNRDGKLRSYSGFRRPFGRFLKEKGLQNITFHQFRHKFATMMLERGVNPRVVQEFLGHKDISTTLGIYTGVASDVMKAAADNADEALTIRHPLTRFGKRAWWSNSHLYRHRYRSERLECHSPPYYVTTRARMNLAREFT